VYQLKTTTVQLVSLALKRKIGEAFPAMQGL